VVKKEVIAAAGPFSSQYDGAQDHDFIFRCIEQAKQVVHIPKILYHWRCHSGSTSENPESKLYAFESGIRAVKAHLDRLGIPAAVEHGVKYGMYRVRYERAYDPLISVIIPNKDHKEDLELCLRSLEKSSYKNYEVLIVENNSTKEETFRYYEELEQNPHIRVLYWKEGFNYSAINNFAAKEAKGEYLLLFDGTKSTALIEVRNDPQHKKNLLGTQPVIEKEMERELKAIIQQYMHRMINDKLVPENE
jgi:hypothetical protein